MRSSKEGSDIEAGKGELRRGRGQRGMGRQVQPRGALALGQLGKVMVQTPGERQKTKTKTVVDL